MNCFNEKCTYFSRLMESNCSCGDDTEYAERCLKNNYCYYKPADLPQAGASAERISAVRYQLAISALKAIVDPIGHMKKQLKEDERLDGMYAIRIAERPEFYQDIAKKALEEIANCT